MDIEWLRRYCLSLPHATEDVQWESLLFRIAGKIFALVSLDNQRVEGAGKPVLCFKCTPEEFSELIELEDVMQAPYFARKQWIAITRLDALPGAELQRRLARSYELVFARLPKKTQRELSAG